SVRLDHITSSGLGLDDTSQHSRHTRSLRPNPMPVRAPKARRDCNSLLSDNGCVEPPDPIPNSEVKRTRADGSVGLPCESRSSLSIYTARPVPERDRPCSFARGNVPEGAPRSAHRKRRTEWRHCPGALLLGGEGSGPDRGIASCVRLVDKKKPAL